MKEKPPGKIFGDKKLETEGKTDKALGKWKNAVAAKVIGERSAAWSQESDLCERLNAPRFLQRKQA